MIHGGVVTAMLDESCGMAVQLALDGSSAIATLDLRIDYQKPAKPVSTSKRIRTAATSRVRSPSCAPPPIRKPSRILSRPPPRAS